MRQVVLLTLTGSIIALLWTAVTGNSQRMFCETVEDAFSRDESSTQRVSTSRLQGVPGKKGPKGERGEPGIPGETGAAGVVNNEKVNAMLEDLVNSVERKMMSKIQTLERTLDRTNEMVVEIKRLITCDGGMVYRGKCFRTVIHDTKDIDYYKAVRICKRKSGKLAYIHGSHHYSMVVEHIRSKMPSISWVGLWLSMTVDPRTEVVSLPNGQQAPYVNFHPGYPDPTTHRTKMLIDVSKSVSDTEQGMWNDPPGYSAHGVLCQEELQN